MTQEQTTVAQALARCLHRAGAYTAGDQVPPCAILWTDPEGNLLGGFFKLWKENGALLKGDLEAIKGNALAGFDEIIKLEAAKIKQ